MDPRSLLHAAQVREPSVVHPGSDIGDIGDIGDVGHVEGQPEQARPAEGGW